MTDPQPAQTASFVELMTRYQGRLYGYALTLTGNSDSANDILQETNVVLWKQWREFEPGSNFKAWAFRIAHFQFMAHRQRMLRDRVLYSDDLLASLAEESKKLDDRFEERSAALGRCLSRIPARSQEAIRMRYAEGLGVGELAEKMDLTANAVSQILFRARRWLIDCVKRAHAAEASYE